MKINKKIIEELVGYLKEFKLSEIEYAEGTTKVKVSRSINNSSIVASEVKKKQTIIESDGTNIPYRLKMRSPAFTALSVIDEIAAGWLLSDVLAILGSLDIVLGEIDR